MTKFEKAIKLIEERYGNKEEVIGLATIAISKNQDRKPRPAVRMVCAYYEDGAFSISTDARQAKMLQIAENNEVAVCGLGWYSFQGIAENLGWVKEEKNAHIRANFKKYFEWFDDHGGEDDPNSIILKITLTEGTIIDHEAKYGEQKYVIDFVNKTAE